MFAQQYWVGEGTYKYVSVSEMAASWTKSENGMKNRAAVDTAYPKEKNHVHSLVHTNYALPGI